jgi:hypothetical protein
MRRNVPVVGALLSITIIVGALISSPTVASSQGRPGGHPISICHRTDSETNPYVAQTVDASSTQFAGHEGHTGGLWFSGHPKKPKWGDIIPPTDDDHDLTVMAMNWTPMGQAIWQNHCKPPYGPPPGSPKVTCTLISIDPPPTSWIVVTFIGTINGVPFSRSATYGNPVPHLAVIDISDLTTAPGPLHIVVYAIWTLGPGKSLVTDVTITCHESAQT